MPGPIPKRSEERLRQNKPEGVDISKVPMAGKVEIPSLGIADANPFVVDMYNSLIYSGQTKHYEPSDWQTARFAMMIMNDLINNKHHGRPSAQLLTELNSMFSRLMVTEADRRRARVEVTRHADLDVVANPDDDPGNVASLIERRMQRTGGTG